MFGRIILMANAFILGTIGVILNFLPYEILSYFDNAPSAANAVFLQILGAAYFGFAMLNWLSKGIRTGGIYNRPLTVANMAHYAIGAFALLKFVETTEDVSFLYLLALLVYAIMTILFLSLLVKTPKLDN